ncbi:hypothetical protein [uncultured Xylophilus sp.]|uniref:hypothetical protein n=1 Tax=uncultured Xylophilus sp. TaxID=296832 RepID=UPI0025D40B91|nr:hypothetical protein [uncultured Xylophilus sp.]
MGYFEIYEETPMKQLADIQFEPFLPTLLCTLEDSFDNVEHAHRALSARADHDHAFKYDFAEFGAEFFRGGDKVSIDTLLIVWLLDLSLSTQYSPGHADVLSGAAKAYDIVPGGQALRDAIGDFKTEYACANESRKAVFLQAHAERIQAVVAELQGASA